MSVSLQRKVLCDTRVRCLTACQHRQPVPFRLQHSEVPRAGARDGMLAPATAAAADGAVDDADGEQTRRGRRRQVAAECQTRRRRRTHVISILHRVTHVTAKDSDGLTPPVTAVPRIYLDVREQIPHVGRVPTVASCTRPPARPPRWSEPHTASIYHFR